MSANCFSEPPTGALPLDTTVPEIPWGHSPNENSWGHHCEFGAHPTSMFGETMLSVTKEQ